MTDNSKDNFYIQTIIVHYRKVLEDLLTDRTSKIQGFIAQIKEINNEYKLKLRETNQKFRQFLGALNSTADPRDISLASLFSEKRTPAGIHSFLTNSTFPEEGHCTVSLPMNRTLTFTDQILTTTQVTHSELTLQSRCLYLGDHIMLITGGGKNPTLSCSVNMKTQEITGFRTLNIGRKWAAMSFIDGKPAVISGRNPNNEEIKSVEVLDGEWKEVAPLKIARYTHTAARNETATFVFGGDDGRERVNSVEKYCEGKWMVLKCRIPFCGNSVGVWYFGRDKFILLGGQLKIFDKTEKVYVWSEEGVEELPSLPDKYSFPFNLWIRRGNIITSYSENSELISYDISRVDLMP